MANCKNCESVLKKDDKFCSNCGQKVIERLKVRTLLGELAAAFLSWDSKLFRTLKLLLFKPGQVSLNYISGKRKSYVAPLRVYLFFSVLFFIVVSIVGVRTEVEGSDQNVINMTWGGDSSDYHRDTLILMDEHDRLEEIDFVKEQTNPYARKFMKQLVRLAIDGKGFNDIFRNNLSYMLFLFIPVFALILRMFYGKKNLDYIEHLVFGLYFHSFIFAMLILTLLLSRAIDHAFPLLIGVIGAFIYLIIGSRRFYATTWGEVIWKTTILGVIYTILATLFTLITVLVSIWLY